MRHANENVLNWIEQIALNTHEGGRRIVIRKQFGAPWSDSWAPVSAPIISQLVSQRHPHPYSMRCVWTKRSSKRPALTNGNFLRQSVEGKELPQFIVACFGSQCTPNAK